MMHFSELLLLVVLGSYQVYGSELEDPDPLAIITLLRAPGVPSLIKKAYRDAYSGSKLQVISDLVKSAQDEIENITLVGTQNVYGTNGEIVDIRTVELHWPKAKSELGKFTKQHDDEDDDDDVSISEIRTWFNLISLLGFDMSIQSEEFNKEGELVEEIYFANNLVYNYNEGIRLVNKTIEVDSIDKVEKHIEDLKKNHSSSVSVLRFNDQGQFISEGSNVVPAHVVRITSAEGETNEELFDNIKKGLSTLYLEGRGDHDVITAKLVEYLKEIYPKNDFYVFSNEPDAWQLTQKDFFKVTIQYDLAAWESDENILYTVFGGKKG